MINKKIIFLAIEKAIDNLQDNNEPVKEEKCTVSNRPQFKDAIKEISNKNGLQITFGGRGEETSVSLYDEKNKTRINFDKKFLDSNLIDYNNENTDGKVNLEDVISSYTNLPDKMKKATNLITFSGEEFDSEDGGEIYGRSSWIDMERGEFNTVEISPLMFQDNSENLGLDFVMAHETSHCYDYAKIPKYDADVIRGIFEKDDNARLTQKEFDTLVKYGEKNSTDDKFLRSSNSYSDAQEKNKQLIVDTYGDVSPIQLTNGQTLDPYDLMNCSSDYSIYTGTRSEDYAEASAIIITGHNNPSSSITYIDDPVSYGDWVATHPYQAQYLLQDIYGETHTIDELRGWGDSNHLRHAGIDDSFASYL